jgi:hypothetical protein
MAGYEQEVTVDSLPDSLGTPAGGLASLHGTFQPPMDRPYAHHTYVRMVIIVHYMFIHYQLNTRKIDIP